MTVKWCKIGIGLQATKHETRKHGRKFDRYIRGRYQADGELKIVGFGWESEWVAAERARMVAEGDTGARRSFLEYCQGELARLKQNAKRGKGPKTLREDKQLAEAKAKEEEEARALEEKGSITFEALFREHYIPFVTAEGKKSVAQEKSLYKTWIKAELGERRVKDISPLDIERIKHRISKERSERTTQYVLAVIRRIFNFAIQRDLVNMENPTKKVKFPSPDNARVRFFTKEQAQDLIDRLRPKSVQLAEMTEVSLYSGVRWGEVAGLLWADVDADQGTLFVRDPKNKHSRTVPMPERLRSLFKSKERGNAGDMVFPSRKRAQSTWVSKTIARTIEEMGLNAGITDPRQKLSFHSCRHSFCSWLAMEGVPLHVIGELAGHRTLKMVQRYSHLAPQTMKAAVALLDQKPRAEEEPQSKVTPLQG
ncbi:MAG: site-specific integrase [Deltaproteobacteria bacterium]|nr:site-specific integrase [Deltaproteobacteria bacterium]